MKSKTQCITEGSNSPTVVQTKSKASPSQTVSRTALGPVSQRPQTRPLKLSEVSMAREMKLRDHSSPEPRVTKSPSRLSEQMPFYPRPAGMFSAILYSFEDWFIYSVRPFLMAKPFAEYYWSGYAENANESTNYAWDFYPETSFGGLTEGGELHYIDYQSGAYFSLPADSWFFAPTFNAYPGRIDDSGVSPDIYQLRNYEINDAGTAITNVQEAYVIATESSTTFNNIITSSIFRY